MTQSVSISSSPLVFDPHFQFAVREGLEKDCRELNISLESFLPTQSDPQSTGYDVRSSSKEDIILKPGCYVKIPLGLRMFAPQGWWLNLVPRSGTFAKMHLHPLYGVIDETFEGILTFVAQYLPDANDLLFVGQEKKVSFGDRVAQVIPVKRQLMHCSFLSEKDYVSLCAERNAIRKESGFGGSGVK